METKNEKKEFFLTRWIKKLCVWADEKLFPVVGVGEPTYIPMLWSFCVSFVGGMLLGIQSLFSGNPESRFPLIVMIIAMAAVAVIYALYLIKDLKRFETTGMKIGRSVYILFLVGISFAVGFYLAMLVMIVLVCIFVLWLCLTMMSSSAESSSNREEPEYVPPQEPELKEITLYDGTVLDVEKGPWGGESYTERNTGHSWRKNTDGSFSPN